MVPRTEPTGARVPEGGIRQGGREGVRAGGEGSGRDREPKGRGRGLGSFLSSPPLLLPCRCGRNQTKGSSPSLQLHLRLPWLLSPPSNNWHLSPSPYVSRLSRALPSCQSCLIALLHPRLSSFHLPFVRIFSRARGFFWSTSGRAYHGSHLGAFKLSAYIEGDGIFLGRRARGRAIILIARVPFSMSQQLEFSRRGRRVSARSFELGFAGGDSRVWKSAPLSRVCACRDILGEHMA